MTPPSVRPEPVKVCTTSYVDGRPKRKTVPKDSSPPRPRVVPYRFPSSASMTPAGGRSPSGTKKSWMSTTFPSRSLRKSAPRDPDTGEIEHPVGGLEDPTAGLLRDRVGGEVVELRVRARARQAKQRAAAVGAAEGRRAVEVPVARLHQPAGRFGSVGPGEGVKSGETRPSRRCGRSVPELRPCPGSPSRRRGFRPERRRGCRGSRRRLPENSWTRSGPPERRKTVPSPDAPPPAVPQSVPSAVWTRSAAGFATGAGPP